MWINQFQLSKLNLSQAPIWFTSSIKIHIFDRKISEKLAICSFLRHLCTKIEQVTQSSRSYGPKFRINEETDKMREKHLSNLFQEDSFNETTFIIRNNVVADEFLKFQINTIIIIWMESNRNVSFFSCFTMDIFDMIITVWRLITNCTDNLEVRFISGSGSANKVVLIGDGGGQSTFL